MARRQNTPVPLGGMVTSGDPANVDGVPKLKNVAVRPGPRYDKRPGFLRESTLPSVSSTFQFMKYRSTSADVLMLGTSGGSSQYFRTSGGAWTGAGFSGSISGTATDYTNFLGKMYYCTSGSSGKIFSFDGTTVTEIGSYGGYSVETFIRRLFIGGLSTTPSSETSHDQAYFVSGWSLGGTAALSAIGTKTKLTFNAPTDYITSTFGYATTKEGEYAFTYFDVCPVSTTQDVPITVEIWDGVTAYGSVETIVYRSSADNPQWQRIYLTAPLPTLGTNVRCRLKASTSSINATVGMSIYISDTTADDNGDRHGATLGKGRVFLQFRNTPDALASASDYLPSVTYRLMWSETDDPTNVRNQNYYDCKEVPGDITTVRANAGRLAVFKSNAIWTFIPTANPDTPIVFEQLMTNVGCVGRKAHDVFDGKDYFVGEHDIYEWDRQNEPRSISGPNIRDTLFSSSTKVSTPLLKVDTDNREVWVYIQVGKIHIYNLDTQQWTYYTVTGPSDSELAISDLIYVKPQGESVREMWVLMAAGANVVRLHSSQTQDDITGTPRDVVAEVVLKPVQAQSPRSEVTVEELGLLHKITSDQTGSTFEVDVSRDDGVTYGNSNTVTVTSLSVGDIVRAAIPVWHTAPRLTLRLKHTGLAGPTYFNVYGADLWVQRRGGEIPKDRPTAVSNTL